MGRPERPVDPRAGAVQRFAHELRVLREAAGKPTYRVMAGRAGFSVSVLAQAASGERLPSLAVVLAYAQACGADPAEWELRWKTAADEAADEEAAARAEEKAQQAPYRGWCGSSPVTTGCSSAATGLWRSCRIWCTSTGSRWCSVRPAAGSPPCCGPG